MNAPPLGTATPPLGTAALHVGSAVLSVGVAVLLLSRSVRLLGRKLPPLGFRVLLGFSVLPLSKKAVPLPEPEGPVVGEGCQW